MAHHIRVVSPEMVKKCTESDTFIKATGINLLTDTTNGRIIIRRTPIEENTMYIINTENTPASRSFFKGRIGFHAQITETADRKKLVVKLTRDESGNQITIARYLKNLDFVGLNLRTKEIFNNHNGKKDIFVESNLTAKQAGLLA